MSTLKSVLVILVASCTSAAPLEETYNVAVIRAAERAENLYDTFLEKEDVDAEDMKIDKRRNSWYSIDRKWPNGRVPYEIHTQHSSSMAEMIQAAMREIEHDVGGPNGDCVQFVPRNGEANYIDVTMGRRCRSHVGMGVGKQQLSLDSDCGHKNIIMHELLHVLGFRHEHNRYDRDLYININSTNIEVGRRRNFYKMHSAWSAAFNTPYDYNSIMHYGPYSFARIQLYPVITPKKGHGKGIMLGQRLALSKWDVIRIQRMYRCKEDTTHIKKMLADSLLFCTFENGMCKLTNDKNTTLQWRVTSGVTTAGPAAGHTNGADVYLVAGGLGRNGTARLMTPYFRTAICVELVVFLGGSTSNLKVSVSGPNIVPAVLRSVRGTNTGGWTGASISLDLPVVEDFQIVFEADVSAGAVGLDDINMTKGTCM